MNSPNALTLPDVQKAVVQRLALRYVRDSNELDGLWVSGLEECRALCQGGPIILAPQSCGMVGLDASLCLDECTELGWFRHHGQRKPPKAPLFQVAGCSRH